MMKSKDNMKHTNKWWNQKINMKHTNKWWNQKIIRSTQINDEIKR